MRASDMDFLTSNVLQLAGISHGFFTRQGGVSAGLYASLNCAFGSEDINGNVTENRQRIAACLGTDGARVCTNSQVHGTEVTRVQDLWDQGQAPAADALVTATPGFALSILAADCVPVLLADKTAGVIGAAHAGWKGALGGVIEAVVDAMVELGAERSHIVAATGPAIQQPSYEVGREVKQAFLSASNEYGTFFVPSENSDHFQFDLPGMVARRLDEADIAEKEISIVDTYADHDRFFSYRRSTHLGEPDYGRALSSIMISV